MRRHLGRTKFSPTDNTGLAMMRTQPERCNFFEDKDREMPTNQDNRNKSNQSQKQGDNRGTQNMGRDSDSKRQAGNREQDQDRDRKDAPTRDDDSNR